MAKIKIKLNSKRSTTIRATDGAYYKLRAGENIIELEPSAYSALMSALGLKPNNKKQKKEDSKSVAEQPKEQHEADNKQHVVEPKPIVVEQPVEEPIVEPVAEQHDTDNQEQAVCAVNSESREQILDVVASEINSGSDELDSADDNADDSGLANDPFSQMPYSQLKAAYKEITGKNSKLKRNELINFLREHHNAE